MNGVWHFRRISDGALGGNFSGSSEMLALNTPAGYEPVDGALPVVNHVPAPDAAVSMALARRDAELAASDWVTMRAMEQGTPVPPEWLTYRQALRDVTQQPGFPANIAWPIQPSGRSQSS